MKPGLLLRLEAGVVLVGCFLFYGSAEHANWILFGALFLVPDLSIAAYWGGVRVGAAVYNLVHTYVTPAIVVALGAVTAHPILVSIAVIWAAHIALDRLLGFGLKYPTNFKDTHLQRMALVLCVLVPGRAEAQQWPIKTREHVDLWLTGFAELSEDSAAKIPVYRHDYLDQLALAQNQQSVLTALDSVHDGLQARWDAAPKLAEARSLALDAGTWDEMQAAIDMYLKPPDPKKSKKTIIPPVEEHLADYFSSPSDREWLLNFEHGLEGARAQFYHGWWVAEQRRRRPVLAAADSLWRLTEPKLDHFLAATHQATGEIILSLPVDGAGVTFKEPNGRTSLAAPFPDSVGDAAQVIYVFAHVAARAVSEDALTAATTISQRRNGVGEQYAEALSVRGGYMLLSKAAPELADGYARYYLHAAKAGTDLATAFPLPDAIRDALGHQIDLDLK